MKYDILRDEWIN